MQLTPNELQLAVPTGVVLAGAISYLGAWLGSRTLKSNQSSLITAQKVMAAAERANYVADKRHDAYIDMIRVVMKQPVKNVLSTEFDKIGTYIEELTQWDSDLDHATAPFYVYVSPERFKALEDIRNEMRSMIQTFRENRSTILVRRGLAMEQGDSIVDPNYINENNKLAIAADMSIWVLGRKTEAFLKELRSDLQSS